MLIADYIVVGCGLTGSTIARLLTDCGKEVILLERRPHVGGNVHDTVHESGIRYHTYGPHYFRTGSHKIWQFVTRFADFYEYEARVVIQLDGQFVAWPIQTNYLAQVVGREWAPAFEGEPSNFEEASLAMMPRKIYEAFVRGYTQKQWGVDAASLDRNLAKRFEVRKDGDTRLSKQRYQGLPKLGYTAWMTNMVRGIPLFLNVDFMRQAEDFVARKCLVFTGPIDEFFKFQFGKLKYRGQQRRHHFIPDASDTQPCVQVNYPSPADGPKIRSIEWKHLAATPELRLRKGTLITEEEPFDPATPNAYEYPFPDAENRRLYENYFAEAKRNDKVLICGRLGEYRYLDMDQAIARAMMHVGMLVNR